MSKSEHTLKPEQRHIGVMELAERLNCHPVTIYKQYRNWKSVGFPQPRKLVGNRLAFNEAEVNAYIERRGAR